MELNSRQKNQKINWELTSPASLKIIKFVTHFSNSMNCSLYHFLFHSQCVSNYFVYSNQTNCFQNEMIQNEKKTTLLTFLMGLIWLTFFTAFRILAILFEARRTSYIWELFIFPRELVNLLYVTIAAQKGFHFPFVSNNWLRNCLWNWTLDK